MKLDGIVLVALVTGCAHTAVIFPSEAGSEIDLDLRARFSRDLGCPVESTIMGPCDSMVVKGCGRWATYVKEGGAWILDGTVDPLGTPRSPGPLMQRKMRGAMTRPELIAGRNPHYTEEALRAQVQGLFIAKCIITKLGDVEDCKVIQPLPGMTEEILSALYTRRYKPVTLCGEHVNIDYTFRVELTWPGDDLD